MKKLLLPLLAMLFLLACEKEATTDLETEEGTYEDVSATERSSNKRDVCHNGNIININVNAIPAHQGHGDAVDMDQDGYYDIENPCSETDCDDNSYSEDNSCVQIGDITEGGIVFYIAPIPTDLDGDGNLDKGLVCAPSDQNPRIQWYNNDSYTTTGAIGTATGTGLANTNIIILEQGDGIYAAQYCDELIIGIYDNWFLPSKDALNLMYENVGQGNALGLGNIGGFVDFFYSSSSEVNANAAWVQRFDNGIQFSNGVNKHFENYVRAVRAF